MSTILVTGASGFVGSYAVPALLASGHRIAALVRTPESGRVVLDRLPEADRARVELRTGDVTRPGSLPDALAGVDGVLHLVGDPARSQRRRGAAPHQHRGNARGRRRDARGRRQAAGLPGRDGRHRRPRLHYARSKARAEALVAASGLDWTTLKPSLQFGPGDGFFNIIADLVRLSPGSSRYRAPEQPLPADQRRRTCAVIVKTFTDDRHDRPALDLGGPRYWTYREITAEVLGALDKRRPILPMPVPLIRSGGRHVRGDRAAVPCRHRPAPPTEAR